MKKLFGALNNNNLLLIAVFVFCTVSITLIIPVPVQLIQDQDWSHQLAGANQILKGVHPFSGFLSTYGPLTFYTSALMQVLFGGRIIGEIILIIVGYSIAYTLLFWLMWSISRDKILSFFLLVILIILIPRLYKYYIVLGPTLTLFCLWRYLDKPTRIRLWLIGLAVVVTGLFRPDFGVYMILCTIITLFARPTLARRQKLLDAFYLGCVILILALPWLISVSIKGGLFDYLYGSTFNALSHGSGMKLPLTTTREDIFSQEKLQLLAKITFVTIPGFSFISLLRHKNELDSTTQSKLLAAIIGAQLTLIQGLHRADWGHLLQAIPTTFILLAYLIKQAILSITLKKKLPFVRLAISIGLLSIMLRFSLPAWRDISIESIPENFRLYSLPRAQFVKSIVNKYPENSIFQAMNFIQKCTSPNEKIIAWPYLLDFYYFTDRSFGSRYMGLNPGFFNLDMYQLQAVDALSREKVRFFIYRPEKFTDTASNISDYVPLIAQYLDKTYIPLQQYGNITIYVHRHEKVSPICFAE